MRISLIFVSLFCLLSTSICQDQNKFPVKLFILAGQSNMDGCGNSAELPKRFQRESNQVRIWDNQKNIWVGLGETSFSNSRDHLFGPEIAFAHAMMQAFPKHRIALVKTSAGGTKLYRHWLPDSVMYRRLISNLDQALEDLRNQNVPCEISGLLWMQGESDSETPEMANAYAENLKLFFTAIRKQTNKPDLPIAMGRISSSLLKETPWVFDYTEIVQAAQESVAEQDPHVYIINTDRLSTLDDNTHFDTKAQLKLGKKMAQVLLKEIQ